MRFIPFTHYDISSIIAKPKKILVSSGPHSIDIA